MRDSQDDAGSFQTRAATPDLLSELPYLDNLDQLRTLARSMRDRALQALLDVPRRPAWDPSPTPETQCVRRRALHLARSHGLIPPNTTRGSEPALPLLVLFEGATDTHSRAGACSLFPTTPPVPPASTPVSSVPVLFAANHLRTRVDQLSERGDDCGYIRDILLAFYRVLRELYYAEEPDWALGGASCGATHRIVSTFVTSECARALGNLVLTLLRSADMLRSTAGLGTYAVHLNLVARTKPLHLSPQWLQSEVSRTGSSLMSYLRREDGRNIIRTDRVDASEKDPVSLVQSVALEAQTFAEAAKQALDEAIEEVREFRSHEHSLKESERTSSRSREKQTAFELSETAHGHALEALRVVRQHFDSSLAGGVPAVLRPDAAPRLLSDTASAFSAAAQAVHRLLEPVRVFADSRMHAALFAVRSGGSMADLRDLAFAAATSGAITGDWGAVVYREALEVLARALDKNGRLPLGHPFHVGKNGVHRHAINAQALRSVAQLAQHVPCTLPVGFVNQMLRHFLDTAIPLEWPGSAGEQVSGLVWRRHRSASASPYSYWVGAASAFALDRIVRMLDVRINAVVWRHFHVKHPGVMGETPRLEHIMCSDIGIAAAPWDARSPRHAVLRVLEDIRAHLRGTHSRPSGLWSLILYGPPGTGKTTLVESLAASSGLPLVLISPSDFLSGGAEAVERRATAVMSAVSMLTRCVILFDEFDPVLHSRSGAAAAPTSIFGFLTGGMLPRLAELYHSARRNRVAYVLATNHIERLDAAAIRSGRFDAKIGVYPPDAHSRACRLVSQLIYWADEAKPSGVKRDLVGGYDFTCFTQISARAAQLVAETAQCSASELAKRGWFTRPKGGSAPPHGSAWDYLTSTRTEALPPQWPMPVGADRSGGGSAETTAAELVLRQKVETEMVTRYNVQLLRKLQNGALDWKVLVELLSEASADLVQDLEHQLQALRATRRDPDAGATPGPGTAPG